MRITRIASRHLRLPAGSQRISLTEPDAAVSTDVVAVTIETDSGHSGIGFVHAERGAAAIHTLICNDLSALVNEEDPREVERLFRRAQSQFQETGWRGLTARAWSAIDVALWDLRAKLAQAPLYQLLGSARSEAPVYLSGGGRTNTEITRTLKLARPLIEQGVRGLYIDVGGGDVQLDADRVQQARDGLGEDAWIGISVAGRYDLGTALAMAHFYEEDVGVDRYDCPLPPDDTKGYQRLAERMEVPLALGDSFDRRAEFRLLLERGDVRVLRPNLQRLGGITPFLKIAALADVYPVVITPFRLPEIGMHLVCGLSNTDAVEYEPRLSALFEQPLTIERGLLKPGNKAGHGFDFHQAALERYTVGD